MRELNAVCRRRVRLNEPYSAADGVMHTVSVHGDTNELSSVMIEVRNDLLSDDAGVSRIHALMAPCLEKALDAVALDFQNTGPDTHA